MANPPKRSVDGAKGDGPDGVPEKGAAVDGKGGAGPGGLVDGTAVNPAKSPGAAGAAAGAGGGAPATDGESDNGGNENAPGAGIVGVAGDVATVDGEAAAAGATENNASRASETGAPVLTGDAGVVPARSPGGTGVGTGGVTSLAGVGAAGLSSGEGSRRSSSDIDNGTAVDEDSTAGPASVGPASVGPASVGPASVGPASVGPASVGVVDGLGIEAPSAPPSVCGAATSRSSKDIASGTGAGTTGAGSVRTGAGRGVGAGVGRGVGRGVGAAGRSSRANCAHAGRGATAGVGDGDGVEASPSPRFALPLSSVMRGTLPVPMLARGPACALVSGAPRHHRQRETSEEGSCRGPLPGNQPAASGRPHDLRTAFARYPRRTPTMVNAAAPDDPGTPAAHR
jgi:hypothetical protein